jgi:hypothetical protein
VSRTITQFENDAVIGIASARGIVVRDRAALKRVAVHDNSMASYALLRYAANLVAERPNGESNSRGYADINVVYVAVTWLPRTLLVRLFLRELMLFASKRRTTR